MEPFYLKVVRMLSRYLIVVTSCYIMLKDCHKDVIRLS